MDRYDEKDEKKDRPEPVDESPRRQGEILGLGGTAVPKAPGDPHASNDPESVAKRRARAMGADEPGTDRAEGDLPPGEGGAGTDMGTGGSGTNIRKG